jgi:hypothetical protein
MNPLNIHLERRILANHIRGLCSDIFLITVCYIFRTQILAVQMLNLYAALDQQREKSNVLNMEVHWSQSLLSGSK